MKQKKTTLLNFRRDNLKTTNHSNVTYNEFLDTFTLLNISRTNSNQTIKFGRLREHNMRNVFLKTSAENEAGILVLDIFLFFNKAFYEVKASQHVVSIFFDSLRLKMQ